MNTVPHFIDGEAEAERGEAVPKVTVCVRACRDF